MGLDMYLTRKTYVKNWDHHKPEERHQITVLKNGVPVASIKPERIEYIIEQVAYWRKANAIHKWFVDKVQDGEDDCKEYYVEREQLAELADLCSTVIAGTPMTEGAIHVSTSFEAGGPEQGIKTYEPGMVAADRKLAHELLPTQKGFFFGATDYNEHYIADLQYTVDTLSALLDEPEGGDFYYHASW